MAGNSMGVLFRVTTWGESHGPAVGAVIDGCPPGMDLREEDIQKDLDRRRPSGLPWSTPRGEPDRVEILSGVTEGRTLGTPIAIMVRNTQARSSDYESLRDIFRPGHGDYTYHGKYGLRDHKGGGRASARETVARVAAGAVARKVIARHGIRVTAFTRELGGIRAQKTCLEYLEENVLRCPDPEVVPCMLQVLDQAMKDGDTLGGVVEVLVTGCPPGLGEPVFQKMDADLAWALMSIGSVKAVEIGKGLECARMRGSQCNDPMTPEGFLSNNAGGILAGITTGQEIWIRVACKPVPSIRKKQWSVDNNGNPVTLQISGRHDVCVIPRILPVCEAMVCLVLADHLLRQRAISP
ncbi:MAG: chorismate synthase [bacterium]